MASKASFAPDEWARIAASPMVAGIAITAADPSGLWGLLKEGLAGGWALAHVKRTEDANPLVKAVADDITSSDTRSAMRERVQALFRGSPSGEIKHKAVEELRQVSMLLDRKAEADAAAFKAWLREVAQKTAEAGSEGGFLGFGGVAVSEAEKATLAEIDAALKPAAPTA